MPAQECAAVEPVVRMEVEEGAGEVEARSPLLATAAGAESFQVARVLFQEEQAACIRPLQQQHSRPGAPVDVAAEGAEADMATIRQRQRRGRLVAEGARERAKCRLCL